MRVSVFSPRTTPPRHLSSGNGQAEWLLLRMRENARCACREVETRDCVSDCVHEPPIIRREHCCSAPRKHP